MVGDVCAASAKVVDDIDVQLRGICGHNGRLAIGGSQIPSWDCLCSS